MKMFFPSCVLFLLLAASAPAQIVLPGRPSGVVTSDHNVVTRFGPSDYLRNSPRPEYPPGTARGLTGRGIFMTDLSMLYGTVNDVRVLESTGSEALDNAAIAALRNWTFRRYTIYKAAVPVEFGADGHIYIGADPARGPTISAVLAIMSKVDNRKH